MNTVYQDVQEEQLFFLLERGFMKLEITQDAQLARYQKNGMTVTLYSSGKLLVQHKEDQNPDTYFSKFRKKAVKETVKEQHSFDAQYVFGSDETLKGDTFGGLIVSGFLYEPNLKDELELLGVGDSKQLSDQTIIRIATELEHRHPSRCITIELDPEMYNTQLEQKPLTQLLNELHLAVASHKTTEHLHVVDKYPGCTVGDVQVTKGETHSLAVAAASILARSRGLAQFENLSERAGFRLPLGSTHVRQAVVQLLKENKDLHHFVKLHFKNVQTIKEKYL